MVKLVVLYGHPQDPDAFEAYYTNTHVPLALKIPNLQRAEAGKIVATPDGSAPPYYRVAELWFENTEQLQSGLGSLEGQATAEDLQNFATGGVILVIAEFDKVVSLPE